MEPNLPVDFGPFELMEEIAVGGMAVVYKAKLRSVQGIEKVMAIKRIHSDLGGDPEFVKMFVDEARICSRLRHRCIVEVFELGRVRNELFMAMELVEGIDVLKAMRWFATKDTGIPPAVAAHIAAEIADALAYAHNAVDQNGKPLDIVHRDVSPGNILLSRNGGVKLVDFGIARASDNESRTIAGNLKGKYSYMSPEHIVGGEVDGRSDVFALSVVLTEMMMGRRLFTAPNDYDVLMMVSEVDLHRLDKHGFSIPPSLRAVIDLALVRDPADRCTSIQFRNALDKWLEDEKEWGRPQRISEMVNAIEISEKPASIFTNSMRGPETMKIAELAEEAAEEGRKKFIEGLGSFELDEEDMENPPAVTRAETRAASPAAIKTIEPDTVQLEAELDALFDDNPSLFGRVSSRLGEDRDDMIFEESETVFLLGEPKAAVAARAPTTAEPIQFEQRTTTTAAYNLGEPDTLQHFGVPLPTPREFAEAVLLEDATTSPTLHKVNDERPETKPLGSKQPAATGTADISEVSPLRLLFGLALGRAVGRLDVELSSIRKRAYFRDGDAYYVESNLASETLEAFLIKMGKISDAELTMARAVMPSFDNSLEKTLVGLNLAEPRDLIRTAVGRVRLQLVDICSWTKGTARWFQGDIAEASADSARVDTFEVLGKGALALNQDFVTDWASVYPDAPIDLLRSDLDPKRFGLGSRIDFLSSLCDGQRTIRDIQELCPSQSAWLDTLRVMYLMEQTEQLRRRIDA